MEVLRRGADRQPAELRAGEQFFRGRHRAGLRRVDRRNADHPPALACDVVGDEVVGHVRAQPRAAHAEHERPVDALGRQGVPGGVGRQVLAFGGPVARHLDVPSELVEAGPDVRVAVYDHVM